MGGEQLTDGERRARAAGGARGGEDRPAVGSAWAGGGARCRRFRLGSGGVGVGAEGRRRASL
jgi:hypothetical protein